MTELTQLLDAYLENLPKIAALQEQLETLESNQREITKHAVNIAAELGQVNISDYNNTGKSIRLGYDTTYEILGGEFKNPALRVEFFNRVVERMHNDITDKIVFKDNYMIADGQIIKYDDAVLDKKSLKKLMKSLDSEFIQQCLDDKLLWFHSEPVIEVDG